MVLWGFGRAEPRLSERPNFVFHVFLSKKRVVSGSISPFKFMLFVSRPAWVPDQSLNSFPSQQPHP